MIPIKTLLLSTLLLLTYQRCAFRVDQTLHPVKLDQNSDESLPQIVTGLKMCKQYNNKLACCNENNDAQQVISYKQIDSIFGAQGDGCDVCAINLKRFWCEYACSPNQADFTQITGSYYDPTIKSDIQNVTITVQAQTGCDLFSSCKRVSFVTSVSAMGTTAGFLEFQGHNADSQGFQFISTVFTKDMNKSLALSDTFDETQRKSLTACNSKISGQLHGFPFTQNCSCNTCDTACDTNSGFLYTQSSVFQGFNWILVGSTYLICIILAVGVTIKRKMDEKKSKDN